MYHFCWLTLSEIRERKRVLVNDTVKQTFSFLFHLRWSKFFFLRNGIWTSWSTSFNLSVIYTTDQSCKFLNLSTTSEVSKSVPNNAKCCALFARFSPTNSGSFIFLYYFLFFFYFSVILLGISMLIVVQFEHMEFQIILW